ncbi:MAG: hypothetical protein F4Y38_08405 [Gemmatimonadetes bacterium]|nr:hypothetical protein [Gemmatimonadota bacterium]MYJ91367.1 hypothetical protein [Gemmatimonadota bacterium]
MGKTASPRTQEGPRRIQFQPGPGRPDLEGSAQQHTLRPGRQGGAAYTGSRYRYRQGPPRGPRKVRHRSRPTV